MSFKIYIIDWEIISQYLRKYVGNVTLGIVFRLIIIKYGKGGHKSGLSVIELLAS